MIENDIKNLIIYSKDIIDYFDNFGSIFWKQISVEDLKNLPTRRVVTLNDYISALVDVKNAISFLEKQSTIYTDQTNILNQLAKDIEKIILDNVNEEDIFYGLNEDIKYLELEIEKVHDDDLFYYETSCNFRELIEKKISILKDLFSISETQLDGIKSNLRKIDKIIKEIQMRILRIYPEIEKPFPPRPSYTPERYWWHIF